MAHQYLKRVDREADILLTAFGQRQRGRKTFTLYTMAKWIGLAPSTRLKKIIDHLTNEGYFTRKVEQHRPNVIKHIYRPTDKLMEMGRLL